MADKSKVIWELEGRQVGCPGSNYNIFMSSNDKPSVVWELEEGLALNVVDL